MRSKSILVVVILIFLALGVELSTAHTTEIEPFLFGIGAIFLLTD